MSDTVIKIENLGKKYTLTHKQPQKYIALRDVLVDRAKQLGGKILHPFAGGEKAPASGTEEFWALKDVSFDIKQGERVGIIGRNGAGKSTLLKILSRITEPTTGRVSIKGRVASLLEVGTGFHPELTGRENIYLNGAILGMSKAEIKKNFDAIVDFAEVEKFLDTPVKRYSSGMYVRLAFAVAAHLDTEILLVDEVLAVGDAEFQKKCMGKMDEVSHKQGRTILFVSHSMVAIRQLCTRIICLEKGEMVCDASDVSEGIRFYLEKHQEEVSIWININNNHRNQWFFPRRFGIYDCRGKALASMVERQDEVWVEIEGEIEIPHSYLYVGYALYSQEGTLLYWSVQSDQVATQNELPILNNKFILRSRIPLHILNIGKYTLTMIASLHGMERLIHPGMNAPTVSFELTGSVNHSPFRIAKWPGVLYIDNKWELV